MRIVHEVCAGLDVHKKDVKVCLVSRDREGKRQQEVRTFSTMTGGELLKMRDWLQDAGGEVVLEATGVYWKPIFNVVRALARP